MTLQGMTTLQTDTLDKTPLAAMALNPHVDWAQRIRGK